jgi:hypothetical protein
MHPPQVKIGKNLIKNGDFSLPKLKKDEEIIVHDCDTVKSWTIFNCLLKNNVLRPAYDIGQLQGGDMDRNRNSNFGSLSQIVKLKKNVEYIFSADSVDLYNDRVNFINYPFLVIRNINEKNKIVYRVNVGKAGVKFSVNEDEFYRIELFLLLKEFHFGGGSGYRHSGITNIKLLDNLNTNEPEPSHKSMNTQTNAPTKKNSNTQTNSPRIKRKPRSQRIRKNARGNYLMEHFVKENSPYINYHRMKKRGNLNSDSPENNPIIKSLPPKRDSRRFV